MGVFAALTLSPPRASKIHCSLYGIENARSPEYSKFQQKVNSSVRLDRLGLFHIFNTPKKLTSFPGDSCLWKNRIILGNRIVCGKKVGCFKKKIICRKRIAFGKKLLKKRIVCGEE